MGRSIQFYATREDTLDALERFEAALPITYAEAGSSSEPTPIEHHSCRSIPRLGVARSGSHCIQDMLLIAHRGTPIMSRRIAERSGRVRFAVDQLLNPDTVGMRAAGVWDTDCIIAGVVGTATTSNRSLRLLAVIEEVLRPAWTLVGAYRVGPRAMTHLRSGARLTSDVSAPREFDLRL